MEKEFLSESIYFLSSLEGYHQALKMLHWGTFNKSEHLLTDDIDQNILKYEDRIAECIMGCFNVRLNNGLKALLPKSEGLINILNEMETDVIKFENKEYISSHNGLINILDEFIEDINKWKYLSTLK